MITLGGFSAWIESNGTPLPEYLVAVDEDTSQVSCWIPGIEGQTFSVHWKDDDRSKITTCGFITLDGVVVPGRFLFGEGIAHRSGLRVSKSTERPFLFQRIEETDSRVTKKKPAKDAGMVALKLKRVRCIEGRPANPIQSVPSTGALGKRKVGDMCVGLGYEAQIDTQHDLTWKVASYDDDTPGAKPRTFVSFVFRYRSPEFLEAQGIASGISIKLKAKAPVEGPSTSQRNSSSTFPCPLPLPVPQSQTMKMDTVPEPIIMHYKKPRITSAQSSYPSSSRTARRPSIETRRTASWNNGSRVARDDSFSSADTECTEGSFFLPPGYGLQAAASTSTIGAPESSGTSSASPEDMMGTGSFSL